MRNARCADIVYELAFYIDQRMQLDRGRSWATDDVDPASGQPRQIYHPDLSQDEWAAHLLWVFGILGGKEPPTIDGFKPFSPIQFFAIMPLEACLSVDFSDLESLHNYLVCMFTFEQVITFQHGIHDNYIVFDMMARKKRDRDFPPEDQVPLSRFSPRFIEHVARMDDVFAVAHDGTVTFDKGRFRDKIMTRWEATLNRNIRRNSASPA